MLKTTKSITLNGASSINGEVVATMYATISEGGGCNQNLNIVNSTLYEESKKEVRDDITKFNQAMYDQQDDMGGVAVSGT